MNSRRERKGEKSGRLHAALLSLPPERAHDLGLVLLRVAQATAAGRFTLRRHAPRRDERLSQDLLGRTFANPIGLAAGFDKDGEVVEAMADLGFGWIEVGTVTPMPQEGNPRPRLFRHSEARSLENRMGFNNSGAEALARRLERIWPASVPVGVNLGKNKDTPNDLALGDYLVMIERFRTCCDYFVVNVSSPNTPGLRDLQDPGFLRELFTAATALAHQPILLKLAPDLEVGAAVGLVVEAVGAGAEGVILTNTTCDYSLLPTARREGGLSGQVLREKSFMMLDAVASELFGSCLLVSVGGIDSGREAYRRLRAGATLVQIYTALVYQGPDVVRRIAHDLVDCVERDGYGSIGEAVGVDRRSLERGDG